MDMFLFSNRQNTEAPSQIDLYVTRFVLKTHFSSTFLNNPHNYCVLYETILLLNNVSSCDSIGLEWEKKPTTTTTTNLKQTVLEQYLEHFPA